MTNTLSEDVIEWNLAENGEKDPEAGKLVNAKFRNRPCPAEIVNRKFRERHTHEEIVN